MAVKCPVCGSPHTQALVDRYQCLPGAHEFFPDGSPAGSDAYPLADAEPESAKESPKGRKASAAAS